MSDTLTLLMWLVKATALLILAMAISAGLRRAPAGARYLVWLATLVALLLVPAMSAWSPLPLRILPSESATITAAPPTSQAAPAPSPTAPVDPTPNVSRNLPSAPGSTRSMSPSSMLLLAWGSVVALILAWLLHGALSVRRIMRGSRTLAQEAWLTPLYETADRLDLDRVPRLVMSSAIEMPFACSILRPTIVLPKSAEQWTDARRRAVLFHELAHIRRRDLLGHTVGRIVCAFYWFHPLVWSAAKRLRAESERACDDLVLLSGGARASDYANHLLEIVTGVRRQGAPATALPMANKREFEGRMLAILDPAMKRSAPSRGQATLLTAGLGLLSLTIAAVAPTRRIAPPTEPQIIAVLRDSVAEPRDNVAGDTALSRPTVPATTRTSIAQSVVTKTDTAFKVQTVNVESQEPAQEPQKRQPVDTALLGRILRTDKDAGVRRSAAWALQGRRDGVPLLLERLRADEHESVREMAAWALAHVSSSEVAAALADALKRDRSDDVRGTAAWALGHMGGRADVSALEGALGDANADVRQRALWAIGQQQLENAPARVVALLRDEDHDVRLMAAWVLGTILDKSTIPALRDAFMKERDSETLHAEFRALAFMGDRSQALIDRAMSSEDTELRSRAVRLIGGQGPGIWPWPWPWPEPRPEP
jgi:beta-lactamase regulating signal transducer with metallopeptidase domain